MMLALFFLFGCSKQEATMPFEKFVPSETFDSVWILNSQTDSQNWEATSLDNLPKHAPDNITNRSNSAHSHGKLTISDGGETTIKFSGTQNNGGAHGNAEIIQTAGMFTAHFIVQTECVTVINNNEAIYGGVITEVLENNFPPPPPPPGFPAPPCNPNDLGNSVYFSVIDNGQGNNAPADQYYGLVIQGCSPSMDCQSSFPWFIFQPIDVDNAGDKIKVNN